MKRVGWEWKHAEGKCVCLPLGLMPRCEEAQLQDYPQAQILGGGWMQHWDLLWEGSSRALGAKVRLLPSSSSISESSAPTATEGQVSGGFSVPCPLFHLFLALGALPGAFPTPAICGRTVSLIDSDIWGRPRRLVGMHSAPSPLPGDNRGGISARPGNEVLNLL